MHKLLSAAVFAVALLATASPALANGTMGNSYWVMLDNWSDNSLIAISMRRDGGEWKDSILTQAELSPGQFSFIDLDDGSGYCIYDIQIHSSGKNAQTWRRYGVNICLLKELIIRNGGYAEIRPTEAE